MLKEIELRSLVLNKMYWVYADDVYSTLNINENITLGIIDAADLKQHNGVNIISEWALLALDVHLKDDDIERKFILI